MRRIRVSIRFVSVALLLSIESRYWAPVIRARLTKSTTPGQGGIEGIIWASQSSQNEAQSGPVEGFRLSSTPPYREVSFSFRATRFSWGSGRKRRPGAE